MVTVYSNPPVNNRRPSRPISPYDRDGRSAARPHPRYPRPHPSYHRPRHRLPLTPRHVINIYEKT